MALTLIVTDVGRAALVNAAHTGTAPVTVASVGLSGAAVAPSRTATGLPGEFKRVATIAGDVVAADTIHLIVRDESSDVFTLRSMGLYLADGTLFGIYGQAEPILEKSSQAMMLISVDVKFEDIAADRIAFGNTDFLNPPATTERQGVVELATVAEAKAGIDQLRALTPEGAKAAILGWLLTQDGAGSGLDADLLDGQQGSFYTDIPARLGYTPVSKSGDIFTGPFGRDTSFYVDFLGNNPLVNFDANDYFVFDRANDALSLIVGSQARMIWRKAGNVDVYGTNNICFNGVALWSGANDGSGSGLDADLLDGQDGSYYVNIPARLGYAPANRAGDTFTGPILRDSGFYLNFLEGNNPLVNFDANDYLVFDRANDALSLIVGSQARMIWRKTGNVDVYGTNNICFNGVALWSGANDGSGSGLDADLLDGRDGSYYVNIPARLGYAPANRAGDTFNGPIGRDGGFYLDLTQGNNPLINFDANDYFVFDRGSNVLSLNLSSQARMIWRENGNLDCYATTNITFNDLAIWHAGNDGAGSGLDADMLDGQDSGFYVNIPARLGYTPLNKAGDQITGPLEIVYPGSATLTLNSSSVAVGRLAMQSDGNLVLYRDDGAGPKPIFSIPSQTDPFNIQRTLTRQGNIVWDAANDGSGSGLDADLLDGQQGSFYADIPARLGYTPVSKSGDIFKGPFGRDASFYINLLDGNPLINFDAADYLLFDRSANALSVMIGGASRASVSAAGILAVQSSVNIAGSVAWHAGNDGAGSGLDADLLDGQQGSFYADIPARLGFNPVNRSGDRMTGPLDIVYPGSPTLTLNSSGVAVGRLAMQGDGSLVLYRDDGSGANAIFSVQNQTDPFNVQRTLTRQGNIVWDAANDGSGSGLDADFLDGFQASDFLRVLSSGLSGNGHLRLALKNGPDLLLNWGRFVSSATPGAPVWNQFDRPFAGEPFTLVALPVVTTSNTVSTWADNNITGEGFNGRCTIASIGCRFFAIGLAA